MTSGLHFSHIVLKMSLRTMGVLMMTSAVLSLAASVAWPVSLLADERKGTGSHSFGASGATQRTYSAFWSPLHRKAVWRLAFASSMSFLHATFCLTVPPHADHSLPNQTSLHCSHRNSLCMDISAACLAI